MRISFIFILSLSLNGFAQDGDKRTITAPQIKKEQSAVEASTNKPQKIRKSDEEKKKEAQQNLMSLFTLENLYKLLFSEEQDELVNAYLDNFKETSEEDIKKNLGRTISNSPLSNFIDEDGVFVHLYARIHKDRNILLSLAGIFKDRSQFFLFIVVSAFLFLLGYFRKKYKKRVKGTPGAFLKNVILLSFIMFLHVVSIVFFFGNNMRPAIMAYREIAREVNYGEKL